MSESPSSKRSKTSADDEAFVVITTVYPTSYGCYRGKSWSRAELIARSDVSVSSPLKDYKEAVKAAREARAQHSEYFFDEELEEDQEPPYDSADLKNYDNDEEVRVEIRTQAKFDEEQESDQRHLQQARSQRHFQDLVQQGLMRLRIKEGGNVHYSNPPKPYDIAADLELKEKDMANITTYEVPSNASSIKTFRFDGKRPDFRDFLSQESINTNHALIKVLRACTSLEELYIRTEGFQDTITPNFLRTVLQEAPHLKDTLKVLSMVYLKIDPDAIPIFAEFHQLVRLDIRNSLSSEYYQGDYGDDEELPYDVVLSSLIEDHLPQLERLDLGFEDWEQKRCLTNYILSFDALESIQDEMEHAGELTRTDDNDPPEFETEEREEAAREHVFVKIWNDADLPQPVRDLAESALKVCPLCEQRASKRCTACTRQWYCSVECQKNDSEEHKAVCEQVFKDN